MKILIESLLYQGYFDEKVTMEFLGDVNQEIDRLNLVISDLLRMVQLDQTEERLHLQSVSVTALRRRGQTPHTHCPEEGNRAVGGASEASDDGGSGQA